MNRYLFSLVLIVFGVVTSQAQAVIQIHQVPVQGVLLDKGWKWHPGDNADWARPGIDDSTWEAIDPTKEIHALPQVRQAQLGWFRLRIRVTPAMLNQSLTVLIGQVGASEIYLNGRLIYRFGVVSADDQIEQTRNLKNQPFSLKFDQQASQVLAVRYSFNRNNLYVTNIPRFPVLRLLVKPSNEAYADYTAQKDLRYSQNLVLIGLFLVLGVLYLVLYSSSRAEKAYLYIGIFMVEESGQYVCQSIETFINSTTQGVVLLFIGHLLRVSSGVILLFGMHLLFRRPKGPFWWVMIGYSFGVMPLFFSTYRWLGVIVNCFYPFCVIAIFHAIFYGLHQRRAGTWVLLITMIAIIPFFSAYVLLSALGKPELAHFFVFFASFVLPIGFSVFLAGEFARTSRSLQNRVTEVKALSEKNLAQEQEKQLMLTTQNETLEKQVHQRTSELVHSLTQLKTTQNQLIQKEKLASLGELTAGIAHEIQNPLNFVNNFAEVAVELADELYQSVEENNLGLTQSLSADLQKSMQQIAQNGQRASNIVRSMLEHAQSSTGERQSIQLNAVAEEYLRLAYHGFRAKDSLFTATLKTDFEFNLPPLEGVVQDLSRVLLNLYNNAFYTLRQRQLQEDQQGPLAYEPTIWVRTRLVEGPPDCRAVELCVQDNGMGVPATIRDKVFQPFFTTKPTGQGTGLGLSLSYDIITKGHGGELHLESQEGQGTTFIIKLPLP